MPPELTSLLAEHEAERLANAIARQLDHRSLAELGERINRHWEFWKFKIAADLVRSPVAVAHRMLRRDYDDCVDVRCEDGWQIDLDAPCKACAQAAEDITRQRPSTPLQPPLTPSMINTPLPGRAPTLDAPLPHNRVAAHASKARAMLAARSPRARTKIINEVA